MLVSPRNNFLLSGTVEQHASGQLADKQLLKQFRQIECFPSTDRYVVKVFLDAFFTKKKVQQLGG